MTICLILRNLVNLSQIEDLDVNSAHSIFEGGGYEEILEISRFDRILEMGRLPMSNVATQFSLRTKTMGSKPHRIGMMTILNNSWHFLVHANLTQMPEFRVEEQFRDASARNGSISNILPSIDSSSIDGRMLHASSLRPLASLKALGSPQVKKSLSHAELDRQLNPFFSKTALGIIFIF